MVFFGEAKWTSYANEDEAPEPEEGEEPVETHGAHGEFKPHESPPIMLIPLVVLAGWRSSAAHPAAVVGVIPRAAEHKLEDWLHPVVGFGEADIDGTWAYDTRSC